MPAQQQSTKPPPNIPQPLTYGRDFPRFRMVMSNGRTRFESRTNRNLFLTPEHFTDNGTFTMGQFLSMHRHDDCVPADGASICSLLAEARRGPRIDMDDFGDEVRLDEGGISLHERINLEGCAVYRGLRETCQTEAQRAFLDRYTQACADSVIGLEDAMNEYLAEHDEPPSLVENALLELGLPFAALIPEVWLNYLGPNQTDADRDHLAKNPSRVDFAMFARGKKWVIEIDGPSHYATWIESSRQYAISQEQYTRNLRIERSLQYDQDWNVRRFSDYEVTTTPAAKYANQLLRYLPGARETLVWIDRDDVARRLDIPF